MAPGGAGAGDALLLAAAARAEPSRAEPAAAMARQAAPLGPPERLPGHPLGPGGAGMASLRSLLQAPGKSPERRARDPSACECPPACRPGPARPRTTCPRGRAPACTCARRPGVCVHVCACPGLRGGGCMRVCNQLRVCLHVPH